MNKKQVKCLSDACIYHALGRYIETNFLESEYLDKPISPEDQKKIRDYMRKVQHKFLNEQCDALTIDNIYRSVISWVK